MIQLKHFCAALWMMGLSSAFPASAQTPAQIEAAKAAVIAKLRDPESARWGTFRITTTKDNRGVAMEVLCGTVNAKNLYGGYVGFRGFVYAPGVDDAMIEGTDQTFTTDYVGQIVGTETVRRHCR